MLATIRRLGVLGCLALLACGRGADGAAPTVTVSSASPSPGDRSSKSMTASPPATLLTLGVSAYAAHLELDDEAVYLLTSSAAHRIVPGRPPERWALDLGVSPVLAGEHFVYWSEGAIRRASKRGGPPEIVAEVSRQPQRLSASEHHLAWLEQAADGSFTLWSLEGSRPSKILTPENYVSALKLLGDQVCFVEQLPGAGYRLGVVPISGGEPRFSSVRRGRTPAMLAAARDIFYYDGPSRTVRRLSTDLEQEVTIARDVICSPLAVAERVYCAQPAGLLEFPAEGGAARVVSIADSGAITDVVASESRVTWLVDAGREQLEVRTLALP